ncbi:MAG: hypothetical protein J6C46_00920, partial [Clostridia bacterium]|nr:hypothetical protein [Clostridia bacterium]
TRLVYQRAIEALDEKYGMELPKVAGTDYCIGHWYGALRLPGTTTTNPDNPGEDDGYIIVTLDDVISEIDNPDPTKPPISYLETDPESINYDNDGDGDPEDPDGKDPDGNGPGGNPDGNDPGGDPDGDPDGNDPGGRPGVGNPDVDIDGDGIPDDPIFTPDNRPIFKPEKGFPGIIFETIPGRVDNEVAGTH